MKVVFLDIDGVLCTIRSFARTDRVPMPKEVYLPFRGDYWDRLDEDCVSRLNRVTDGTGAKIVISSSWRLMCQNANQFKILADYLTSEGITAKIIGRTPSHAKLSEPRGIGGRGAEIQEWLDTDGKKMGVTSFVIFDDYNDMGSLVNKLVETPYETGIGESHVLRAIEILNEQ